MKITEFFKSKPKLGPVYDKEEVANAEANEGDYGDADSGAGKKRKRHVTIPDSSESPEPELAPMPKQSVKRKQL